MTTQKGQKTQNSVQLAEPGQKDVLRDLAALIGSLDAVNEPGESVSGAERCLALLHELFPPSIFEFFSFAYLVDVAEHDPISARSEILWDQDFAHKEMLYRFEFRLTLYHATGQGFLNTALITGESTSEDENGEEEEMVYALESGIVLYPYAHADNAAALASLLRHYYQKADEAQQGKQGKQMDVKMLEGKGNQKKASTLL